MLKLLLFILILINSFSTASSKDYKNLFIGDSNINYADIENLFIDINATHISKYGGDTSMILKDLKRIDDYLIYNLENIFLMVGTNDVLQGKISSEEFFQNIDKIFSYLKNRTSANFHMYEILPTNKHSDNKRVKEFNKKLQTNFYKLKKYNVVLIELYKFYYNYTNEENKNEYYNDTIHLNKEGYKLLRDITYNYLLEEKF